MVRPRFRVTETHKASFSYVMLAAPGDNVSVGREDPEMKGWFWCKDDEGVEMWVPSTHLNIKGSIGVFNQPYNSKEIDAKPGDIVQFLGETLGWVECLDKQWRYGWIERNKLTQV
jgi:hypothetical protein